MKFSSIVLTCLVTLVAGEADAATMQWSVASGGNGHYYENRADGVTWLEAREIAESLTYNGLQGHLVTITSAAENLWLTQTFPSNSGAMLGAWQPDPTAEKAEGWSWVTIEPWEYTNWLPGEPNDYDGREDIAQFRGSPNSYGFRWNDADIDVALPHFLVEYDDVPLASAVPEPTSLALWSSLGIMGLIAARRRCKRAA